MGFEEKKDTCCVTETRNKTSNNPSGATTATDKLEEWVMSSFTFTAAPHDTYKVQLWNRCPFYVVLKQSESCCGSLTTEETIPSFIADCFHRLSLEEARQGPGQRVCYDNHVSLKQRVLHLITYSKTSVIFNNCRMWYCKLKNHPVLTHMSW